MTTFEVALGLGLVAALAMLLIADREMLRGCICGRDAASPAHFPCANRFRRPQCLNHHPYHSSDWPYGLLALAMIATVAAWLLGVR